MGITGKIKEYKKYSKNREHYEQLEKYLESKTFLPSLHIVKQNNIHLYRENFGISILVETGTFMGDMVEAQKRHFKKVYSIELSEDLYKQALRRFEQDSNVKILQGDSGVVLKDLLEHLNEPALFWLDGHYSAGITAKSDKNTPILAELSLVLNHHNSNVILIDDARLFTGEEDYPSIPDLCAYVHAISPEKKIIVADDIIRITNSI